MLREETIHSIEEKKIIAITRGIYGEELLKLARALFKGGIRNFEITYDQTDPDTDTKIAHDIQALNDEFHGELCAGCGTVLTEEQAANAAKAGARFIVAPNFNPKVLKATLEAGLVSMPGCMTPTEICAADEAGADFIKLFPAGTMGMKYCKDIMAPIHHVKYIATVGVTEETFREYLEMGFAGAGISSRLIDKKLREAGKWDELTKRAERFCAIAQEYGR
jgi:2-dehydro-3-deoxyphosphogluconate aldolase/(4S)-4-hydroxy-2-oxoglutarate aldolase